MTPQLRSILRVSPLALLSVLSGCAKDQNIDDWRRAKMNENLAELQAPAGTYRGTLISKQSGDALGALEMTLTPQIRVLPGAPGEKSNGLATLAAQLTFADSESRLAITALDSFFDSSTGNLEVSMNLTRSTGRTEQVVISGVITQNSLAGVLQVTGAPEMAGKFELQRNAPETLSEISQKLESGKASTDGRPSQPGKSNLLLGQTVFKSGESRPVSLVFVEPSLTPEEQFLNRFAPIQVLQFALNFGDSLKIVHNGALWDRRTGKLTGRGTMIQNGSTGSSSVEIVTECEANETQWQCAHQSQGQGVVATTRVSLHSAPDAGPVRDDSPDARRMINLDRTGAATLSSGELSATLKATYAARTREQELWDLFNPTPEKILTVALQFGIPTQSENERLVIVFDRAILDLRGHTLDARTQIRQGAAVFEVQLRCDHFEFPELEGKPQDKPQPSTCQYSSSHRQQPLTIVWK